MYYDEYIKDIEKLKNEYSDLFKFHRRQMINAGLYLQAVSECVEDKELINKIVDRHFELMEKSLRKRKGV